MKKSDIKLNQLNNMNIKVNTNSIDITMFFTISNSPLPQQLDIALQRVR